MKILIVEDEPDMLKNMADSLRKESYIIEVMVLLFYLKCLLMKKALFLKGRQDSNIQIYG